MGSAASWECSPTGGVCHVPRCSARLAGSNVECSAELNNKNLASYKKRRCATQSTLGILRGFLGPDHVQMTSIQEKELYGSNQLKKDISVPLKASWEF